MRSIFTLLFISAALFSSAQQNTFAVKAFSDILVNFKQVIQLGDGSFVSVGQISGGFNFTGVDDYLVKTDAGGQVLASRVLYGGGSAYNVELIKTYDGGFAICGAFGSQPYLIKFAADLSEQWQRSFIPYNTSISINRMQQTLDSGFLVTGSTGVKGVLIKTNNRGKVEFVKSYSDDSSHVRFDDAVAMPDSNYIVAGVAGGITPTDTLRTVKVRPDGSVIWSHSLYHTGTGIQDGVTAVAARDGGVVITGASLVENGRGGYRAYQLMVKYDSTGNRLWAKTIATPELNEVIAGSVTEDRDGGYLFCGELRTYKDTTYTDGDTSYGYIVKTDANGELVTASTIAPNADHHLFISHVIVTADGGYAACGDGYFFNNSINRVDGEGVIYKLTGGFVLCNAAPGSLGSLSNFSTDVLDDSLPPVTDVDGYSPPLFFSPFDEGHTANLCSSGVLPVQLLSFTAALQGKSVSVNWKTVNEVNTGYFVVERSADKTSFAALQKVAAKANGSAVQAYSINDLQPLQGTSYYRLKEVDRDGKVMYSSIVPVTVMSDGMVVISPNPVQNNIHVVIQSVANNTVTLQVVDMKGNVLAAQTKAVGAGRNEIAILASSLAKGLYILKVTDSRTSQAIRFIKE